jgi:hypothetical protein
MFFNIVMFRAEIFNYMSSRPHLTSPFRVRTGDLWSLFMQGRRLWLANSLTSRRISSEITRMSTPTRFGPLPPGPLQRSPSATQTPQSSSAGAAASGLVVSDALWSLLSDKVDAPAPPESVSPSDVPEALSSPASSPAESAAVQVVTPIRVASGRTPQPVTRLVLAPAPPTSLTHSPTVHKRAALSATSPYAALARKQGRPVAPVAAVLPHADTPLRSVLSSPARTFAARPLTPEQAYQAAAAAAATASVAAVEAQSVTHPAVAAAASSAIPAPAAAASAGARVAPVPFAPAVSAVSVPGLVPPPPPPAALPTYHHNPRRIATTVHCATGETAGPEAGPASEPERGSLGRDGRVVGRCYALHAGLHAAVEGFLRARAVADAVEAAAAAAAGPAASTAPAAAAAVAAAAAADGGGGSRPQGVLTDMLPRALPHAFPRWRRPRVVYTSPTRVCLFARSRWAAYIRRAAEIDARVAAAADAGPSGAAGGLELAMAKGVQHEAHVLALLRGAGRAVTDLTMPGAGRTEKCWATVEAITAGKSVIYQGTVSGPIWSRGAPPVLALAADVTQRHAAAAAAVPKVAAAATADPEASTTTLPGASDPCPPEPLTGLPQDIAAADTGALGETLAAAAAVAAEVTAAGLNPDADPVVVTESTEATGAARATVTAQSAAADSFQLGCVMSVQSSGIFDFLVRVPEAETSETGFVYDIWDAKLANTPKVEALLQIGHYALLLKDLCPPSVTFRHGVVALGSGRLYRFPLADVVGCARLIHAAYGGFISRFHPELPPPPMPAAAALQGGYAQLAAWTHARRDHVSATAWLTSTQAAKLTDAGIDTLARLAHIGTYANYSRVVYLPRATLEALGLRAGAPELGAPCPRAGRVPGFAPVRLGWARAAVAALLEGRPPPTQERDLPEPSDWARPFLTGAYSARARRALAAAAATAAAGAGDSSVDSAAVVAAGTTPKRGGGRRPRTSAAAAGFAAADGIELPSTLAGVPLATAQTLAFQAAVQDIARVSAAVARARLRAVLRVLITRAAGDMDRALAYLSAVHTVPVDKPAPTGEAEDTAAAVAAGEVMTAAMPAAAAADLLRALARAPGFESFCTHVSTQLTHARSGLSRRRHLTSEDDPESTPRARGRPRPRPRQGTPTRTGWRRSTTPKQRSCGWLTRLQMRSSRRRRSPSRTRLLPVPPLPPQPPPLTPPPPPQSQCPSRSPPMSGRGSARSASGLGTAPPAPTPPLLVSPTAPAGVIMTPQTLLPQVSCFYRPQLPCGPVPA